MGTVFNLAMTTLTARCISTAPMKTGILRVSYRVPEPEVEWIGPVQPPGWRERFSKVIKELLHIVADAVRAYRDFNRTVKLGMRMGG